MTSINYNNAQITDAVLREFNETDLEITSEYVELWDVGREAVVGAWISSNGNIVEVLDETEIEAENELALDVFRAIFKQEAANARD